MNLGALRTRVLERLDETTGGGLRWTSAEVDAYLNLAYQILCVRSGVLIDTATITAQAGQLYYDLPTDCVWPLRLYRDSPREKVWPSHARKRDERTLNWQELTGTRWEWYFQFGLDQIVAGPMFTTDGAAYTLTYVKDPGLTSLSADTDEPDFSRRYHEALADYAVARALMVDADEKRLQSVKLAMSEFARVVRRVRKESQKAHGRLRTMRPEDPDEADWGVLT